MELITAKLKLLIIGASAKELRRYKRLLADGEKTGYSLITPTSEVIEIETLLSSDPDCILLDCDHPVPIIPGISVQLLDQESAVFNLLLSLSWSTRVMRQRRLTQWNEVPKISFLRMRCLLI